jgi:thymidylate synthase
MIDKNYLAIVAKVLHKGRMKHNRTGQDALTIPFVSIQHEMSDGFPLLTTKRVPLRIVAVELEGFLKGITDKDWYKHRGCNIWNEWANPVEVKARYEDQLTSCLELGETPETYLEVQAGESDLGPIYGYQWRKFGEEYGVYSTSGVRNGFDQLKAIVNSLENNPNDRRMVCSAWNPNQFQLMALPPCHVLWNVVVIDDTINLGWYQRSCDLMLGVPFNIASYGLLLTLLAKHSGLKPGVLHGTLADCHIYENHLEKAKVQLEREPRQLPVVRVPNSDEDFNIFHWTSDDLQVVDYNPHPRIDFGGVAI